MSRVTRSSNKNIPSSILNTYPSERKKTIKKSTANNAPEDNSEENKDVNNEQGERLRLEEEESDIKKGEDLNTEEDEYSDIEENQHQNKEGSDDSISHIGSIDNICSSTLMSEDESFEGARALRVEPSENSEKSRSGDSERNSINQARTLSRSRNLTPEFTENAEFLVECAPSSCKIVNHEINLSGVRRKLCFQKGKLDSELSTSLENLSSISPETLGSGIKILKSAKTSPSLFLPSTPSIARVKTNSPKQKKRKIELFYTARSKVPSRYRKDSDACKPKPILKKFIMPDQVNAAVNPAVLTALREALRIVPDFDGKRDSLGRYIAGIEEASALTGAQYDQHLLKLLKVKLTPGVWNKVAKVTFENIKEYVSYLRNTYDPPKDVYELIAELGNNYQKATEKIDDYADRIQTLTEKILEGYTAMAEGEILAEEEKNRVNIMGTKIFIRGLIPEIQQRLKSEDETFNETVNKAKLIERQIADGKRLRMSETVKIKSVERNEKKASINYFEPGKPENKGNPSTIVNEEILVCQFCSQKGHLANECPRIPNAAPTATRIVCQYCQKPGHTADKCLSIKSTINNQGLTICQRCGKRGHLADRCYSIPCQNCGRTGHHPENCTQIQPQGPVQGFTGTQGNPTNSSTTAQNIAPPPQCYNCQEWGHISRNCPRKNTGSMGLNANARCYNCNQWGHLSRNCNQGNANQGTPGIPGAAPYSNPVKPLTYAQAVGPQPFSDVCRFCKQPGHVIDECQARASANNRRANRQGNGNGLPGAGPRAEAETTTHPTFFMRSVEESPNQ